ncbi:MULTISPECIES: hypothetical protein [unclassified Novosphingobium]|uniref:hypothetical protein n=1 Tax=unclassified Novosphingobium TaxID=2644732 RepID=UPI0013588AE6|nr:MULTISPECIES: hypothetical protein [unclassified Novosphingobium]
MTQDISAAYRRDGYTPLRGFVPPEVANGFLARMKGDLDRQGVQMERMRQESPLLARAASELYGFHYPPMATFHWGMTSAVEALVGEPLLPSYSYFRLYREGDICRVHGDRYACEHSLSLTLAYSHDRPWALEVSPVRTEKPYQRADAGFREEERGVAVAMDAGDAVLYQGVHHHHGRTTPNPNAWSAHLFLHWVARAGPYAAEAFDKQPLPPRVRF